MKAEHEHAGGVSAEAAEHMAADHELMKMENDIVTPHVAYFSREANRDIQEISANNVVSFVGGTPINVVA